MQGEKTIGKANKGINVEKIIIGLKIFKLKLKKREKKEKKKGKCPRTAKAQHRGRTTIKKCDWRERKNLKSLIGFHNANKINYKSGGRKRESKRFYITS